MKELEAMELALKYREVDNERLGPSASGHLPLPVSQLIYEKARLDKRLIEDALVIIEFYKKLGCDEFDECMQFIIDKSKSE